MFPEWYRSAASGHDPEVADLFHIRQWAEIGSGRIGLGDDWPRRGGLFGRFEARVANVA